MLRSARSVMRNVPPVHGRNMRGTGRRTATRLKKERRRIARNIANSAPPTAAIGMKRTANTRGLLLVRCIRQTVIAKSNQPNRGRRPTKSGHFKSNGNGRQLTVRRRAFMRHADARLLWDLTGISPKKTWPGFLDTSEDAAQFAGSNYAKITIETTSLPCPREDQTRRATSKSFASPVIARKRTLTRSSSCNRGGCSYDRPSNRRF